MVEQYRETLLWSAAFESEEARRHTSSVKELVEVYAKLRANASTLVAEIAVDLPSFTIHDVNHLDALWEVGSQIVGANFKLNPIEGFVLGCSFLLHDAAMTMAAYPGGFDEIKKTREWQRLHGRIEAQSHGPIADEDLLPIFLREQHAVRAEQLPKISWRSDVGSRYLIDDAEVREKFGEFIGQVSASHWWNHVKLENQFQNKIIPAPAPFPSGWSIDLLKLACVLRTADAAQIDERRAPGFTRALRRHRLSTYSAQHWTFQNRLTQAQNRDDTLFFAAFRPFAKSEASEWWMLHDTLKMIDGELKKTDDLLMRCRGGPARFAARRVANIEAPENLEKCIPTVGWRAVDTAYSVQDIPKLIENLGGYELYGQDPSVAVRELIQNAMDAVRLRQAIDPSAPSPLVEVEVKADSGASVLLIRDNGIGMSEASIVQSLLSFGASGWLNDAAIGEYSDELPHKAMISGKYGIGFFSVFMIAKEVYVRSRRFDASPDQTVELSFENGLESRPILSPAEFSDRMTIGGTEIKILLSERGLSFGQSARSTGKLWTDDKTAHKNLVNLLSRQFPVSTVPLLVASSSKKTSIDGRAWQTEPAAKFLKRVEGEAYPNGEGRVFEDCVRLITEDDGTVVGRGVLYPAQRSNEYRSNLPQVEGSIVAQGARVCGMVLRGAVIGKPMRAARDFAKPVASSDALRRWATEQANLLTTTKIADEEQEDIAETVAVLGGDIGGLKFCEVGGVYLNLEQLRSLLRTRDEIWVAFNAGVSIVKPGHASAVRTDTCVSVGAGFKAVFYTPAEVSDAWFRLEYSRELESFALDVISDEFEIEKELMEKYHVIEDGVHVYNTKVAAWYSDVAGVSCTTGFYYKRGMKLADIKPFFLNKSGRREFYSLG